MRITLFQTNISWLNTATNIQQAEEMLGSAPESDLFIFPEMFTTGFTMEPEKTAGKAKLALEWLKRQAEIFDAAVCATVPCDYDGGFYNRCVFIKPNGETSIYDKRHLFTYSGEDERYTHGHDRVVVEWRGVRFLLQVCYDLRFPVFSRNRKDYDVALYLANWPESRRAVWDILLKARAIENQCYVAGVNRVGDDPMCHYNGGTAIISPYGTVISQCPDNERSSVSAILDIDKLQAFREKFPVLDDADPFKLAYP